MNLSFLDWINPLDGLIGRSRHGRMHRFSFVAQSQFSGRDVEVMLRRYGVHIWGRQAGPGAHRAFFVKQSQAVWAEYVMCRAGVPLTSPLLDSRNAQYAVNHAADGMPIPWTDDGVKPRSLIDRLVERMDLLVP